MIAALVAALALAAGGENRLWLVDVELSGPCDAVRIDCGSAGATTLAGPFLAGETRRLTVPVPVRAPLGVAGLRAAAPPTAVVVPADAAGSVRVLGWNADQPFERLARDAPGALARPRPPARTSAARARAPELALAAAVVALVLALRRRPLVAAGAALAAAAAVLALARSRVTEAEPVELVEWDVADPLALRVHVGHGTLALPRGGLEVLPEGGPIELAGASSGVDGTAEAPGRALAGLERAEPPDLTGEQNAWEPLASAWTRDARGVWRARGAWDLGAPLPGPRAATDPPGWMVGALPPGRGVLLGRSAGGTWVRVLGFEAD